jgi:hypothetical protein
MIEQLYLAEMEPPNADADADEKDEWEDNVSPAI